MYETLNTPPMSDYVLRSNAGGAFCRSRKRIVFADRRNFDRNKPAKNSQIVVPGRPEAIDYLLFDWLNELLVSIRPRSRCVFKVRRETLRWRLGSHRRAKRSIRRGTSSSRSESDHVSPPESRTGIRRLDGRDYCRDLTKTSGPRQIAAVWRLSSCGGSTPPKSSAHCSRSSAVA